MKNTFLILTMAILSSSLPVWAAEEVTNVTVETPAPDGADSAAATTTQTTVIVQEPKPESRDAITGEVVEPTPTTEEDISLRDKVRSKMKN